MVKKITFDKRLFLDKKRAAELKRKVQQLLNASNATLSKPLPSYFGELLLNEIKHSTDQANEHLRERARLLGLME